MKKKAKIFITLLIAVFGIAFTGCSHEEDVRMPDDIIGIWEGENEDLFIRFSNDNIAKPFQIEFQDGQSIGKWNWDDVYYYEPGYNLVIYVTSNYEANVYQIIEMTESTLTWCPVDEIDVVNTDSIGQVIGDIINKAQEGYKLNPELYQRFTRISEDQFLSILEGLDLILNPWEYQ